MITVGLTALLTILSQLCYPNTNLVGLTALYHALKNNSCLSSVPRPTPDAAQATVDAHRCASSGAAGGTQRPRSRPRICYVLLSYCVSCFVIFVIRYPRTKTISRKDAHPMYQRYPRVFFYVMIYCPLPHQSL
jgi:hypothetical protein